MGIFRYVNCFPPALALLAAGKVDTKSLITHRFPLERAEDAMKASLDRGSGVIKAMVTL
jgi:L-iditol 2-dehydrogenase